MAITPDDVTRVAHLARIALSESDSQTMLVELNGILGLIEELQAVDTAGIEPMAHPLSAHQDIALRLRDDQPLPTQTVEQRDALMVNAPAQSEGLFLVPTAIE